MQGNWETHFKAGVQASEKALDHVIKLAYKDGYDKGYSQAIKDRPKIDRFGKVLTGEINESNSNQEGE